MVRGAGSGGGGRLRGTCHPVVKVVLRSRVGSADEARLEQTPYPFQPH